ncbi:MAG: solute carrier family 23 protein [Ancrocorticia sp.]|uniref:solute carrier family 23 protein n=1 Tax=Ancrocorticia sp. TaxID=2593684 RepID=UPI003F90CD05
MKHPVDEVPKAPQLVVLSLQHVLAFYAGAVIVPLLIANSLNLDAATTIHLINADLFTCGIATLIQSLGITKYVGVRLPIIQGVTTTAVAPIIAIGLAVTNGEGGNAGLPAIYGSIIVAGIFTFLAAPYFAKLLRFFPPVVTGSVLFVMGTTLLSVSANDFVDYAEAAPDGIALAYGFGTLLAIILVQRFFRGFFGTISVLVGLVAGTVIAAIAGHLGDDSIGVFHEAEAVAVTTPFYFGAPVFTLTGCISMIIVMIITMVETTGDVFATGEIVNKRINKNHISAALRADGLSTLLGGIMNSFPYTCFAQNVGLVRITRVKSRWVAVGAAVLMIILGVLPKAGAIVNMIPAPVLGGASLAMFANVAWVGMQTIAKSDMRDNRNAVIVTTALGLAMLVTLKPDIALVFPEWAQIFFSSGMTIGAIAAISLNLLFFHVGNQKGQDIVRDHGGRGLGIEDVNAMDREQFVKAFRSVFNTQTWPLEKAWEQRPFASAHDVRDAVQEAVLSGSSANQDALLNDYPDMAQLLGAGDEGEQVVTKDIGSIALEAATPEELDEVARISHDYQEHFGRPFIGYLGPLDTSQQIIASGMRRLANSPTQERIVALAEVVEIANDRFDIALADANPLRAAWEAKFARK